MSCEPVYDAAEHTFTPWCGEAEAMTIGADADY